MSQHDMDVANQTFPATRADLNLALKALGSTSKGSARPTTVYAGQQWIDDDAATDTWRLYIYDGADDIPIGDVDTAGNAFLPAGSGSFGRSLLGSADQATAQGLLGISASGAVPSGLIADFAGTTAPAGWLMCYGQNVSRTTYSDLFTAIGTTYGVGDGSTTFTLPDCRGRVVAGKDDMGGVSANRLTNQTGGLNGDTLGATGGEETHVLSTAELAAHAHTQQGTVASGAGSNHAHSSGITVALGTGTGSPDTTRVRVALNDDTTIGTLSASTGGEAAHTHNVTLSGNTANQGGGGAHNNVQPTIIFNKIIKI